MHRSDLLTILIQACRDSGLVSFETSKEAIVIEDLRDSADITCKDGSVYRTEALIAADGLWSLARRTLFSDDQVHTPQYVAYRGTIPISEVAMYACPDDLLIWAGPEMHLVQYPVRGGKLYNQVAVFKSDRYRSDSDDWGTTDELDRHFSAACPYVFEAVKQVGRGRRWPLFDRNPIIQWARNRVVLFGDAAHPMLQFLAQGACQALEDAVCIADCVDRYAPDIARTFVAFQNTRFLRANSRADDRTFFRAFLASEECGCRFEECVSRRPWSGRLRRVRLALWHEVRQPGGFGIESPDPQRRDLGHADTERWTRGGCLIVAKRTGGTGQA